MLVLWNRPGRPYERPYERPAPSAQHQRTYAVVLQGRAERAREESFLLEQATAARSDRLTMQLAQQVR